MPGLHITDHQMRLYMSCRQTHNAWNGKIVPILKSASGVRAIAGLEELRRRHPKITASIRCTLERRMCVASARWSRAQDVISRQEHDPGRFGLSAYTVVCEQRLAH